MLKSLHIHKFAVLRKIHEIDENNTASRSVDVSVNLLRSAGRTIGCDREPLAGLMLTSVAF